MTVPTVTMSATYAGTLERPERGHFYFHFYREMKALSVPDDPQRAQVYRWEDVVLGEDVVLAEEVVLGTVNRGVTKHSARLAATAYIDHLWRSYAPRFSPYFTGTPYLRIGFAYLDRMTLPQQRRRLKATANVQNHAIYVPLDMLHRKTLVHEVCHLLTWRDRHGPDFCAALVHLWERELGIRESRVRWLALAHGVQIA